MNLSFPNCHGKYKLLTHCIEVIESCNDGYGMKEYSEEALEACNKLVINYRDNLYRKCSFATNSTDIFTRLMNKRNPVMLTFHKVRK